MEEYKVDSTSTNSRNLCDRCGRDMDFRGYTIVNGWKICGICEWEENNKTKQNGNK